MAIKSMKDLEKIVNRYIEKAMFDTCYEIYEVLSQKVSEYYSEYDPVVYERTYMLKNSLEVLPIERNGNIIICKVGWDDDYLAFQYPGTPGQRTNIPATGEDVLYWFNDKSHGGTVSGEHKFWDEAIEEINSRHNSIPELFKKNLKRCGLPVK